MRGCRRRAGRRPSARGCVAGRTLCPEKRYARMLGLKFHIIRLLSSDDVTSCFMFGLNAHAVTAPLCPRNVRSSVGSSEWNASFAIGTPPKRTIVGDGVWSRASRARVCGSSIRFSDRLFERAPSSTRVHARARMDP